MKESRADKLERLGHRIPAVALRRLEHVEPGWADRDFTHVYRQHGHIKKPSWLTFGFVNSKEDPSYYDTVAARIGKTVVPVSKLEAQRYGYLLGEHEHPVIKQGHGLGPDHPTPESWQLVHHGLDEAKRTGSMHGLLVAADHLEEGNTKTGVHLADFLRHLTRVRQHDMHPTYANWVRHSDASWPIEVRVHHLHPEVYINDVPFHHSYPKMINGFRGT